MYNTNVFVSNLDKLIRKNNINDKKIEDDIGLSSGTISKWRYRGSLPSIPVLIKIANYFNITMDNLFVDNAISDAVIDNKNRINITQLSMMNEPINKYVNWNPINEYPFTKKEVEFIIDLMNTEGFVYVDDENNISYYLISEFESDPYDETATIYYFCYNKAYSPELIRMEPQILKEFFMYLHNKFIKENSKNFYKLRRR